jgi:hypothetical protein
MHMWFYLESAGLMEDAAPELSDDVAINGGSVPSCVTKRSNNKKKNNSCAHANPIEIAMESSKKIQEDL